LFESLLKGTPTSVWDCRPGVSSFAEFLVVRVSVLYMSTLRDDASLCATSSGEV